MSAGKIDNRYMEFRLGNQHFAIPLLNVKEVIPKPELTMVPNMPAHFEGMINLRGQILGVFDVRKRLGTKARDTKDQAAEVVIVIEQMGVSVGMIVDEVTKVLHPTKEMIGPAPLKEDDPARHFISAVIQTGQELVMTIYVDQLLELAKYAVAAKAA